MRLEGRRRLDRRGAIAVVAALVLVLMLGFAALAVDLMVICVARAQLRTTADSAALAGATKLVSEDRLRGSANLVKEMASARSAARDLARRNPVLNVALDLPDNPGNAPKQSIVVGFRERATRNFIIDPLLVLKYDTVRVTASRSQAVGGQVPAFFSKILGHSGFDVSATAHATVLNYTIKGFQATGGSPGPTSLIPIALNSTAYDAMRAGTTPDRYSYDEATGNISQKSDGISESNLFPQSSGSGNWGTVNIGTSNNSASFLGNQIRDGVSTADLVSGGYSPSMELNPAITLGGNPGINLGIKSAIQSRIGDEVIVPIFDPVASGGSGNNFNYRIIAFAAVRILDFKAAGANSVLTVQPSYTWDPRAIPGVPQPSWTSGGVIRLSLTR